MKALICLILNALPYAGIALLLNYWYISDGPVLIYFLVQLSISLSICLIMREETKKMWRILFFSQFLSLLLNLLTLYPRLHN